MRALIVCVLICVTTALPADEIYLRNKDVVRGKVVGLQNNTLTLESENFGTLRIEQAKVDRIVFQEATANAPEMATCAGDECELPLQAGKKVAASPAPSVQLGFHRPEKVTFEPLDGPTKLRAPFITPARYNVASESTRRFRISGVKAHPGKQFLATVSVGEVPPADLLAIEHYVIDIDLGAESFRQASQGEPSIDEFAVNRGTQAAIVFPAPPPLVKVTLTLEEEAEPATAGFKFKDLLQLIK